MKLKKPIAVALLTGAMLAGTSGTANANSRHRPSAACLKALEAAETAASLYAESTGNIHDFFSKTSDSAIANSSGGISGATRFIQDQTAFIRTLTDQTGDVTARLKPTATVYAASARACRAGK